MSTFKVEVVPIRLEPHPDADTLSIVEVWGYTCVVRTADFPPGKVSLGAYVPPDNLVPVARPEFAFLKGKEKTDGRARIKVTRLRGVVSQGLLIPAKPHWQAGDDVAAELGVTHYEPPLPLSTGGEDEPAPSGYRPKYNLENWRRYRDLFEAGENVVVTEKIHGANARYCFDEGRMHAAAHANWKKYNPVLNVWWRALDAHPEVSQFCERHPEITVYGEVYGQVQDLKYGAGKNEVRIAVFDLLQGDRWLAHAEARETGGDLPWAPVIYEGPYDARRVETMAEGPSLIPGSDHLREGVVLKPETERTDPTIGRVCLKIVSNGYLERG